MAKKREEVREEQIITSYALVSVSGGWSVVTVKTQGNEVIYKDATEPDMKAIAIETFLITTAKAYFV